MTSLHSSPDNDARWHQCRKQSAHLLGGLPLKAKQPATSDGGKNWDRGGHRDGGVFRHPLPDVSHGYIYFLR
jgi:hypothetical protein